MCFSISVADGQTMLDEFGGLFDTGGSLAGGSLAGSDWERVYFVEAFGLPMIPVMTDEKPGIIQHMQWGMIPRWVKGMEKAEEIRAQTFNARAETIAEKPSFRQSFRDRRCLILVDGFFEWMDVGGKKFPHYIRRKDRRPFAIAGLWDRWQYEEKEFETFSLITTRANPLLERIHNTKKRQPAILREADYKAWIAPGFDEQRLMKMLEPVDETELEAFPVSRLVSFKGENRNTVEAVSPYDYAELSTRQSILF